jgi:hypothetical protein
MNCRGDMRTMSDLPLEFEPLKRQAESIYKEDEEGCLSDLRKGEFTFSDRKSCRARVDERHVWLIFELMRDIIPLDDHCKILSNVILAREKPSNLLC